LIIKRSTKPNADTELEVYQLECYTNIDYFFSLASSLPTPPFDCDTQMVVDRPDLSVVLLCYRSENTLIPYVDKLKTYLSELNITWEIILVGNYIDGSNDKTPEVVRNLAKQDSRFKALTQKKEGMMGWDMKCGLKSSTGSTIAIIDGDGQYPPEDIGRVYKKLTDENLDIVKTYRSKRLDGWYRSQLSDTYNFIINIIFPKLSCHDVNSKPKILKAEALQKMDLLSNDWFIDAEIMIQTRRFNLKFSEIPTQFEKLDSRESFVKPGAIIEFLANIILFRFREFRFLFKK
jgi:glycosyltransferase involved in cell wall biosynthesis